LVIHVEGVGLLLLWKTCRLCLWCDTLIVQKSEVEDLPATVVNVSKPDDLVLGTVNRQAYRRSLAGAVSLAEVRAHASDVKSYWSMETRPGGWYRRTEAGSGRAG